MNRGDPRPEALDEALRRVAADAAPGLLEQIFQESRREAADILKERLTAAMVQEMERLLPAGSPPEAPGDAHKVSSVVPLVRAEKPALSGWYVYGITRSQAAHALDAGSGVDGAPVEVISAGELAALVSPLQDAAAWDVEGGGADTLEALAPRARAHEAVLERVMDRGAVLPLRFGVLYPDVDRLREVLTERADAFGRALGALEGRTEWGLTLTSESSAEDPTASAPADGRDYLSRRRTEREAGQARAETLSQVAAAVHDGLRELSSAAVIHRTAGPGRRPAVVLRASYLVPIESAGAFRQTCEALLTDAPPELGLSGELTGPWPPYHFCDVSLDGVPA